MSTSKSKKEPSEADIIFNRASVALAKSQRLIQSWLPPRTEEELKNAKTQEELDREEEELFKPIPDSIGLGAPLPSEIKDGSANRTKLSSNDKLLQQLIGKKGMKERRKAEEQKKANAERQGMKKASTNLAQAVKKDEESEEESRATSFKSKNAKRREKQKEKKRQAQEEQDVKGEPEARLGAEEDEAIETLDAGKKRKAEEAVSDDEDTGYDAGASGEGKDTTSTDNASTKSKKPTSFLDEVLSERKKKKKRRKNKHKHGDGDAE